MRQALFRSLLSSGSHLHKWQVRRLPFHLPHLITPICLSPSTHISNIGSGYYFLSHCSSTISLQYSTQWQTVIDVNDITGKHVKCRVFFSGISWWNNGSANQFLYIFCGGEEKKHVFKDRRWPPESAQLTPMKLLNHTSIISKLEVKTNNQDYIEIQAEQL